MRKRILLFMALAIILAILISLLFNDFVNEFIITPIVYVLWITRLIFESFDQWTVWISLLIISLILSYLSFIPRKRSYRQIKKEETDYPNRVQVWIDRLNSVDKGEYLKWRLAQNISGLTLETLAYRAGLSLDQTTDGLETGKLLAPHDILTFIQSTQHIAKLNYYYNDKLPRRPISPAQPLDFNPEDIACYLEENLNFQTSYSKIDKLFTTLDKQ